MASASPTDSRLSIQGFLLLDVFVRLFVWSMSFAVTAAIMSRLRLWPVEPPWRDPQSSNWIQQSSNWVQQSSSFALPWSLCWRWGQAFSTAILIFNTAYVAVLVILKTPIPTPREGRYALRGGRLDRQLLWSAFTAVITKARYEAPFPAFLVHHVCNLPPMSWLVGATLGPRSRSCNVTQTILADPHLTTIGRNVVIGYGASISAHTQDRDGVTIARTDLEDDALIGAHSLIYGGCKIGRGATILGGAVVKPFTRVGPNEIWGGVPAVKIKDMLPV